MNEDVKTYLLLKSYAIYYFLAYELSIVSFAKLAFTECRTIFSDLNSLWKRTDSCCWQERQAKFFLCCLAGMGACLLSAYINTFFAALYAADTIAATAEIAPVVEEVMKLLPLLFYLLVFEPEPVPIKNAAIIVALSFATFENICYLIQNGAGHFSFIFFRGIGTGAMHVICGAIVGGGLAYVWQRTWLKIAGTCGLLGAAITFHAIYNLLIAYGGAIQYIAYILPVLILTVGKLIVRLPQSHN